MASWGGSGDSDDQRSPVHEKLAQTPMRAAPPRPVAVCFDEPCVPAFLLKLYTMLEDPNTDDIISWTPAGDTFVVHKLPEFSSLMLPQFFKHSNFQSFVRQLNLYGFHKLKQAPNWNEFGHQLFKRGQKQLLRDIKRKPAPAGKQKKEISTKKLVTEGPTQTSGDAQPALLSHSYSHMHNPSSNGSASLSLPFDSQAIEQRLVRLERQNDLVVRENRVLWSEVYTINEMQEKISKKIGAVQSIVTQLMQAMPNSRQSTQEPLNHEAANTYSIPPPSIENFALPAPQPNEFSRISQQQSHTQGNGNDFMDPFSKIDSEIGGAQSGETFHPNSPTMSREDSFNEWMKTNKDMYDNQVCCGVCLSSKGRESQTCRRGN
eukprot:c3030_g1_i2.p1 GENE.c3030_g1_i2~~c3030_g1_i2.p1  ORF type:complete len:375 (+),score=71.72 c3030_g1_i2:162-1286(+)